MASAIYPHPEEVAGHWPATVSKDAACQSSTILDALFDRLAGRWHLARRIDTGASLSGEAVFHPEGDGTLAYRETGRLRLADGRSFDAERRYLYRRIAGGVAVLFDERPPRLFHEVRLAAGPDGRLRGSASHRCGDDLYRSRYLFPAAGGFLIRHRVAGPRKAYVMTTWYGRAGS